MIPFRNVWGTGTVGDGTKLAAFVDIGGVVGEDCSIQAFVSIPPGVILGDRVFVGPGTNFCNDKNPKALQSFEISGIQVGDDVSIGANCTILPGIKIGKGSFIGAGSTVTKDVPPGETWYGNPAKKAT